MFVLKNSIIASFTIEQADNLTRHENAPSVQPKKPLRGILTNYGFALPDPTLPDRKSIWFTSGTIEPADDSLDEWKNIFGSPENDAAKSQSGADKARKLASRILLGVVPEKMDNTGMLGFHLKKPIGGHGSAYVDLVYMDDELRVMRGHSGSIYVFKRD